MRASGPGKEALRVWFFQSLATNGGQHDWSAFDLSLPGRCVVPRTDWPKSEGEGR
jgi:hypothetical protein